MIRIEPSRGWVSLRLGDVWRSRELLYFFVWRDVKVRYKQTALGASWAVIQPFVTMVVFSIFFGRLANVPSDGLPYPIFAFSALLPWTLFANGLTKSASSLVQSSSMISKVYFPRLVVPVAAVLAGLVDFAIAFVVLIGMMAWYGFGPSLAALLLPVFVLLAVATALGAGVGLSALNVRYRDVQQGIPFLVQFWLFATPIAYPSSLLGEPWRTVYGLNPMVGVVDGFRWALLPEAPAPGRSIIVSVTVTLLMLIVGTIYFRRAERRFADVV